MIVPPLVRPYRKEPLLFAVVVSILLVAAALRFAWLDRYPLGWHHDEALMGVMADEVYRGVERPIFFRQYLGQEPLYIYAGALAMAALGDGDFLPLRITSAGFGLLTVAVTFAFARALFGPRIGLLTMALLATSFWQVMFSRLTYRSISQPLVEALAAYFLWRCYERRTVGWFILAGTALGATWYTYLGARAFVGVFIGFAAWLILIGHCPRRSDLRNAAVLFGTAVAVVAPLGIFFLKNPDTFSARMTQVFIFRSGLLDRHAWHLFAENALNVARGFTFDGEGVWRYNLPGRPIFVGLVAVAFYLGLLLLARRLGRRDAAAGLIAVWLGVMLFPSLLSWDVGDYNLRASGLVPALYVVPALGLDWVARRLAALPRVGPTLALAALATVLVSDGVWTARDYFVVWAPSFGAVWEAHGDAVAQARFLDHNAQPVREDVYVGSAYYHHPDLAYLARPIYPYLRWFDGRQDIVFDPASPRPSLYVLAFSGAPANVDEVLPRADQVGEEDFPSGITGKPPPLYRAYRLTPAEVRAQVARLAGDPRLHPVVGRVPGLVTPLGARVSGPARSGGELQATLLWRVDGMPPPGEYQLAVQVLDYNNQKIAEVEGVGYPVEEWRTGRVVWSQFTIPVPRDAAPGQDRIAWILYNRVTGQRLPVAGGAPGIDGLLLGDARVLAGIPPPAPSHAVNARLGPDVTLLGFDQPVPSASGLDVALDWKSDDPLDRDYTVFVQLLNARGQLVAQSDAYPAGGALPTSAWLPGEVVHDPHHLVLPANLPAGSYQVIAGMYLAANGTRLPVGGGGDYVSLETISLPGR